MRLAWLTDIHLNFVTAPERTRFIESLAVHSPDALLLGGDIGEAQSIEDYLCSIADTLRKPVYFVLGNHDFYKGAIASVRENARELTRRNPNLIYLSAAGLVHLTDDTPLLGHDSWADGRLGCYEESHVILNDYVQILDLAGLDKQKRLRRLNQLGDEAACYFQEALPKALAAHRNVILLTHVPPFAESAWHESQPSDSNYLPHFACGAVGEVLRGIMLTHADRNLTVLCGHTHGAGTAQILPNLLVRTGGAEYGVPVLQDMIEI